MPAQVQDGSLSFAARDTLRRAVAASAGRKASQVAIESVSRAKTGPGITVTLSVAMGTDALTAQNLVTALLVRQDVPGDSLVYSSDAN